MSVSVEFDWDVACDAELVGAAAAGDRAAFAGIYDRYADRLYDFCVGIVGQRDAADCVQEAFCTAVVALPTLRDPDKLRPWLYAIARNQALRTLRTRRRETASDDLPEVASTEVGPDARAARNELVALVAQAEGGLSDRDREVLDLVYRHGLSVAELAHALDVSNDSAKKIVQRLGQTVERSLGALVVARQARAGHITCSELATIVADWDGRFTILVRKRISRHVETCANCGEHRSRLFSAKALLGTSPMLIPAPSWLLEHTMAQVGRGLGPVATSGAAAAHVGVLTGRFAVWAAAVVAVPVVVFGATAVMRDGSVTPTQSSPSPPATSLASASNTTANTITPQPITLTPPTNSPSHPVDSGPDGPKVQPTGRVPVSVPSATLPSTAAATRMPVATSTRAAPSPSATAHPDNSPTRSKEPPVKRCDDGTTVEDGKSCPTPKPTQPPQTPPPVNCPHIAVPNGPMCGRPTP